MKNASDRFLLLLAVGAFFARGAFCAEPSKTELFRERMGEGWTWVRENPTGWRMSPDALEILIEPGNMWGPANDARNVLVRKVPNPVEGPIAVSMVVSNRPTEQYEQMDLVWYYDDGHMVKIGQERVDGQLSIVMGREEGDKTRTIKIVPIDLYTVELRLSANGRQVTGAFRVPGNQNWQRVGECDLPASGALNVSIQCYQGPPKAEHWGRISRFSLSTETRRAAIEVSEKVLFGDLDCFQIQTPSATYLYGKRGAGFASIIDPDGHDWISYRHGGKALGEYRGLPKCGQPVKYFHCGYGYGQYTNENPFISRITLRSRDHAQIRSETRLKDAACVWDFFPLYATMKLEKCGADNYWFLYEGTPGGRLDPEEDFVVRPSGRTPLSQPWMETVPWVVFGAKESAFGLLLVNQQNDSPNDSYVSWPYKPEPDGGINQMTVFGFGRRGWEDPKQHTPTLTKLPATFSIAIAPGTESAQIDSLLKLISAGGK